MCSPLSDVVAQNLEKNLDFFFWVELIEKTSCNLFDKTDLFTWTFASPRNAEEQGITSIHG